MQDDETFPMSRVMRFIEQPLWVRVLRGVALALLLGGLVYIVPTPYQMIAPGPTQAVEPQIKIAAKSYPVEGKFLLPTVLEEPASVLYCLYAMLDPEAKLVSRGSSRPHAQGPVDLQGPGDLQGPRDMAISQFAASRVALRAAGFEVGGRFDGLQILDLMASSPNRDLLHPGDILKRINGQDVSSLGDLRHRLDELPSDAEFQAQILRDEKSLEFRLKVLRVGERNLIGVRLKPNYSDMTLPFDITFSETETIGGSGGLIFALEIYNRLTPFDLTQGRTIAATGTINGDGVVGPISGLEQKLAGAERAGATILLAPKESLENLTDHESPVRIIGVNSFQEALDALK